MKRIDELIERSLSRQEIEGEDINTRPDNGKLIKYPTGTIAILPEKSRIILLTVISQLTFNGAEKHTKSSIAHLNAALQSIWKMARIKGAQRNIAMPILGSGLANINLSNLMILRIIVLSFLAESRNNKICDQLTIVVSENKYDPEDFNKIDRFLSEIAI